MNALDPNFFKSIDDLLKAAEGEPTPSPSNEALAENETPATDNLSERTIIADLPAHYDGWPRRQMLTKPNPRDPLLDREWRWWNALDEALDAAKKGALIVIYGGHGGGKTQMAMEIAKALPDRYYPRQKEGRFELPLVIRPLIYRKAMEFFNDLRATYHAKSKTTEKEVIARYATCALVVIDEAHERGEKAFEDRQLTLMIDKRYDEMLPTILITNLTKADFYATLSPAVKSRMIETAVGIVADWGTFRNRKAASK